MINSYCNYFWHLCVKICAIFPTLIFCLLLTSHHMSLCKMVSKSNHYPERVKCKRKKKYKVSPVWVHATLKTTGKTHFGWKQLSVLSLKEGFMLNKNYLVFGWILLFEMLFMLLKQKIQCFLTVFTIYAVVCGLLFNTV